MSWNHVVLEGHCRHDRQTFENLPCCDVKTGFTSILCFRNNGTSALCPYFEFTKARSCIVLTDELGNDKACDVFWCDESDNDEFERKEKEWIEKWKETLDCRKAL